MTRIIQIRKKGTLTLPVEIRRRYQLNEGDPLIVIDLEEGIFLSPKRAVVPKLVNHIEELRREKGLSLAELIEGVRAMRTQSE